MKRVASADMARTPMRSAERIATAQLGDYSVVTTAN
jgi:cob(I)alamin adenosyltransferase